MEHIFKVESVDELLPLIKDMYPCIIDVLCKNNSTIAPVKYRPTAQWSCAWGYEDDKYIKMSESSTVRYYIEHAFLYMGEVKVISFDEDEYVKFVQKNRGSVGVAEYRHDATEDEIRQYYKHIKEKNLSHE